MNFHTPGWVARYLRFRTEQPFEMRLIRNSAINLTTRDDLLYQTLHQSGVLFGCPVMESGHAAHHSDLRFLNVQDQATFINIDTLFFTLLREIALLTPNLSSYEVLLTRTLIRTLQFYLSSDVEGCCFEMTVENLLDDKLFSRLIRKFEKRFLKRIRIRTGFTLANSLQNSFAFLDIYSLINWNRRFHRRSSAPVYYLKEIETRHIILQKQLVLIFAGLIWHAQEELDPQSRKHLLRHQKQQMLKRYITTSRLPFHDKRELLRTVKNPVKLEEINYEINEPIIKKYMLEQTILFSLIDDDENPADIPFVKELGKALGMGESELEASISSVAEFFHKFEDRFDFIRGNKAFSHMKENINRRITLTIRKNLDRIVNEIKQTGKLYSLLSKSGAQELTVEEKIFAKEQLLSVAKTIPALAIFSLPAGGMVLAVLIKVLPFNILPNSFAE